MWCEAHESNENVANPDIALNTLENNVLQSTVQQMNAELPIKFLYNAQIDEDWNFTVSINCNTVTFHPFVDGIDLDFFNKTILDLANTDEEISIEDYFIESEPANKESRQAIVNVWIGDKMLISNRVDGIFPRNDITSTRQIGSFFSQMINPL